MERLISKQMEKAYRYRHHNFGGLTVTETAKKMGITEREVQRLLADMKKIALQLFPILTKLQFDIYNLWLEGYFILDIAYILGISKSAVNDTIYHAKNKLGLYFPPHSRQLPYTETLDNQIKETF